MLKRTRPILLLFFCMRIISGCNNRMIPVRYDIPFGMAGKTYTGSWVDLTYNDTDNQLFIISGELLAITDDTIYLLTEKYLLPVDTTKIEKAVLYIFRGQGATGPIVGSLAFIPNIAGALSYADGEYFILLGAPVLVTGIVFGLLETGGKGTLRYPERNRLEEFVKFARYPQGLPPGLNKEKLHLLK